MAILLLQDAGRALAMGFQEKVIGQMVICTNQAVDFQSLLLHSSPALGRTFPLHSENREGKDMTANGTIRIRPTGAVAVMGRTGFPKVISRTGGEIEIKTGTSEAGFNPLDLIYASLSACLAMSARIAASKLGLLDRLESVTADVSGEKAEDEPSRLAVFEVRFDIRGDFDDETRRQIAHLAEEVCTISNTIAGQPRFSVSLV